MKKNIIILVIFSVFVIGFSIFVGFEIGKRVNKNTLDIQVSNNGKLAEEYIKENSKMENESMQYNEDGNLESQENEKTKKEFSKEDIEVFELIKRYHSEFTYSKFYETTNDIERKMFFEKDKESGLYLGIYQFYHVTYSDYRTINFYYNAGRALWGFGSYYVMDDNTVIKIEKTGGSSASEYKIFENGLAINRINCQTTGEKTHPIDIKFNEAINNWSGVTSEGVDIIVLYGDMWKSEMEINYNLLYKELNDEKKKWLITSQEKWETFSKENQELIWQIYDQKYHGGSIMQIFSAEIYYNKYRDRAIFLSEKYKELTSGM
ncbi:UNVERIFIED_CONTAM: hypothetical protein Cloal_2783 [Acetivibrio alkalicellulosi]